MVKKGERPEPDDFAVGVGFNVTANMNITGNLTSLRLNETSNITETNAN